MIVHWLSAHSQHFFWVVYVAGGGLLTWKYAPLTLVRLVGAFTTDPQRHRQCAEILRLARKDAADIPSYVGELPTRSDLAMRRPTDRERPRHRSSAQSESTNQAPPLETLPQQSQRSVGKGRNPSAGAIRNGSAPHRRDPNKHATPQAN